MLTDVENEPQGWRPNGCLLLGGGILLFSGVLASLAYFYGDVTAHNRSSGNSEPIGPTLYILATVFGYIGLLTGFLGGYLSVQRPRGDPNRDG